MATCPQGQVWSPSKNQCMVLNDWIAYIQELIVRFQVDPNDTTSKNAYQQELSLNQQTLADYQTAHSTDVLGIKSFLDKLGQNLVKIIVIGVGLVLVVVAINAYATGQKIEVKLPGKKS